MILLADRLLDAPPDQETIGGLHVTVRRNAFGRQVDSFESDLAFEGLEGGPVHAVFIRAPWVEEAGEDVVVLGRVVGGAADGRIVAVRQGNLVATSFHPELTGDRRVHALFVDIVRSHWPSRPACRREREGELMSGHSKWATTKHKKAGIDAKRGKLFAKLIKNIEVAARTGGGDLSGNPTLFDAVQKAKKSSVPNDNIDRAVKRGAGTRGRRRGLPEHHVRGLRPRRGRRAHGVPHRQQEPCGR